MGGFVLTNACRAVKLYSTNLQNFILSSRGDDKVSTKGIRPAELRGNLYKMMHAVVKLGNCLYLG